MVVYRYRKHLLGPFLTNHVLIKLPSDFRRLRHAESCRLPTGILVEFLIKDALADVNTIIANIDTRSGNEFAHLRMAFATERAHGEIGSPSHLTSATEFHELQEDTTLPLVCGSRSARISLRDFTTSSTNP